LRCFKGDVRGSQGAEKRRVFYLDLISGDDGCHFKEYCGEEIVMEEFEKGTVQSYYNLEKINKLTKDLFQIKDAILVQKQSVISQGRNARYHLIIENL